MNLNAAKNVMPTIGMKPSKASSAWPCRHSSAAEKTTQAAWRWRTIAPRAKPRAKEAKAQKTAASLAEATTTRRSARREKVRARTQVEEREKEKIGFPSPRDNGRTIILDRRHPRGTPGIRTKAEAKEEVEKEKEEWETSTSKQADIGRLKDRCCLFHHWEE